MDRLVQFKKYYNIFNDDTKINLNVILDNRKQDFDVSEIIDTFNIYYTIYKPRLFRFWDRFSFIKI